MKEFVSKVLIDKGWSGDEKYCVTDREGKKYLLRVTPLSRKQKRTESYALQCMAYERKVATPKPLGIEVREDGVYTLEEWIDGVDARELIPTLTPEQQWTYGIEAAKALKKLHAIPAPEDAAEWSERFGAKLDRKIAQYKDCPICFDGAERIIAYIRANRHLLKDRPQSAHHGDFHIGNMMVAHGKLYVIDYDRCDYGDPWEEFNRIVWSAQASPDFARGIVEGYFVGNVPDLFWELLALYIASNTLSSVAWAVGFGEDDLKIMIDQAMDVLSWYDDMTNPVPRWYGRG